MGRGPVTKPPFDLSDHPATSAEHNEQKRCVAIAGGHTAGHVVTGLVIAEEYQLAFPEVSVLFIGADGGPELQLVPAAGYPLATVRSSPMAGERLFGRVRSLWHLFRGRQEARRLLRDRNIELVIGLGSYASVAPVVAARSLGIPAVLHEANRTFGLANRYLSSWVQRIFLGWEAPPCPTTALELAEFTGNPVRRNILAVGAQRTCNFGSDEPSARHLLIMGGSQGSAFLNAHAPELLSQLRNKGLKISVTHITGEVDTAPIRHCYAQLGIEAELFRYIEDLSSEYERADFAITCAGGLTIAELATVGLPALLVPLETAAADHQVENAKTFAQSTGCFWTPEHRWQAELLANQMAPVLRDPDVWRRQSEQMRSWSQPDAAQRLVESCERLLAASTCRT